MPEVGLNFSNEVGLRREELRIKFLSYAASTSRKQRKTGTPKRCASGRYLSDFGDGCVTIKAM